MGDISKETVAQIVKRIDSNVEEVKKQTIETNGRVTKLEKWKWKITGALIVISFVLSPTVYILISILLQK